MCVSVSFLEVTVPSALENLLKSALWEKKYQNEFKYIVPQMCEVTASDGHLLTPDPPDCDFQKKICWGLSIVYNGLKTHPYRICDI